MDSTSSVSKGVFVFKPKKETKNKSFNEKSRNKHIFSNELWYNSYKHLWTSMKSKIKNLNNETFSSILKNLLGYITNCYKHIETEIPTAAILMGINMSDHFVQFSTLSEQIKICISPHVAVLDSEDCANIKALIENMVFQFVHGKYFDDSDSDSESNSDIRKTLCTFDLLNSWYKQKYNLNVSPSKKLRKNEVKKKLVVIIPEIESFHEDVLRNFILIVSSYLNVLPIVIIFGVATSLTTIHKILPYNVTCKINIQVFNSQPPAEHLNNVLNQVFLNESSLFHLAGNAFTLLTDIFLFYDFSVKEFIKNFKFAMLKHFYSNGNAMALCTDLKNLDEILAKFVDKDFESVRQLMSFRKFVESRDYKARIKLITNNIYFEKELKKSLIQFHEYLFCFHVLLECLFQLVFDLPGAPFGKQFREIYAIAVSKNIVETDEFEQCYQFLLFLSKNQLKMKLLKIISILEKKSRKNQFIALKKALNIFYKFQDDLYTVEFFSHSANNSNSTPALAEKLTLTKLKEELLKMSKNKSVTDETRDKHLKQLKCLFAEHLTVPKSKPFHEIFFFDDPNAIRNHIVGSHRAVIHTALNNPSLYLQCECCKLSTSSIQSTLPDICILYKLHLECGKFINLYDWLQAFVSIIQPVENDEEEQRNVDPKLQARFTRSVAELEFLGFIKSSKRKTDHVQRLTWGGI